ncbi:unnamed protein product [Adineta steineri]|uniref:Transmembrane protein n=1 Tax=Adineta steineri TaxID=433720 RepID=A0A814RCL8_9BILA|nr:unnamed protein product [Adineta steineri]
MNSEKHLGTNNWWINKSKFISKYVLSYCFYIHILLLIPLAIIQLRFSTVYDDRCTIDDRIILYLMAIGITQVIYSFNGILLVIFSFLYNKYYFIPYILVICFAIQQILFISVIIWFIIGNYLVFSIQNTVQYTNSYIPGTYCDYTLYHIAYWTIIVYYILIVLFSIILLLTNMQWFLKQFKKCKNYYSRKESEQSIQI